MRKLKVTLVKHKNHKWCFRIWTQGFNNSVPCTQFSINSSSFKKLLIEDWGCFSGKESTYQCSRRKFCLWVRKIPWRRAWQPTPLFLTGKSHGQRSLVGYSLWGLKRVGNNLVTKLLRMDAQFICLIFFNCHIERRKQKHNITHIQTENSISENTAVIPKDMGSL